MTLSWLNSSSAVSISKRESPSKMESYNQARDWYRGLPVVWKKVEANSSLPEKLSRMIEPIVNLHHKDLLRKFL